MSLRKYIKSVIKNISQNLRVATNKICSAVIEAGRTISYVETLSNKADTLHRHIKNSNERTIKGAFEFNTRRAIARMGLGKVALAFDITKELYYGKHGKLNVRQVKYEKGADEAFTYLVLSVVDPRPLPLMALPYKQGEDITSLIEEILEYVKLLSLNIDVVLFDRGFYIGSLISYLSSERLRYLIFVPQNKAMKRYIKQTNSIASFNHIIRYTKNQSEWKTITKIVILKSKYFNQKKKQWQECYWCFATNLKQSLYLISKYKKRWQIETDFRVHDEARIKSKSNEPIIRYFYFMTSLVLMANWQVNRLIYPEICFKKYLKIIQEKIDRQEVT